MSESFCIIERSAGRGGELSADDIVGMDVGTADARATTWLVCACWSAAAGRDLGSGIPSVAVGFVAVTATRGSSSGAIAGRKSCGNHLDSSASLAVVNSDCTAASAERFSCPNAALLAGIGARKRSSNEVAFPGRAAEANVGRVELVIQTATTSAHPIAAKASKALLGRLERRDGLLAFAALSAIEPPFPTRRGRTKSPKD
jgi:hypothetical protein